MPLLFRDFFFLIPDMFSLEAREPKRYTSLKLVIRTLLQLLKIFYYDKSSFGNVANMLKYYNKNGLVESFVRSSIVPISCIYPSLCCHAHTSSNLTVIICTAHVTSVLCHTWQDTHHTQHKINNFFTTHHPSASPRFVLSSKEMLGNDVDDDTVESGGSKFTSTGRHSPISMEPASPQHTAHAAVHSPTNCCCSDASVMRNVQG